MRQATVYLGVVVRLVFEHRLVQVDGSALQNDAQPEQRHEHRGDEECGDGLRNKIEGEVDEGSVRRAQDKVMVAAIGILTGEQALPQHIEARRSKSEKPSANRDECDGLLRQIDAGDECAPAEEVGQCGGRHEKPPGGLRKIIDAPYACEEAEHEGGGLGKKECG